VRQGHCVAELALFERQFLKRKEFSPSSVAPRVIRAAAQPDKAPLAGGS
jgi:hypothetical protein